VGTPDRSHSTAHPMIGESPAIRAIFDLIDRVASTTATVLITGESGTGKEVVARAIHQRSGDPSYPFVSINCAAIPANLLEAELFGYEKGAFTDAKISKKGLLEVSEGGTVFLDEIGIMPLDLQSKILSVLDTRTFRRLGGTKDIRANLRFVAATNEELEQAVAAGRFRQDLYYRLNVVPIILPPLRERGNDILQIAEHFLDIYRKRYDKLKCEFSEVAERWLMNNAWPGNVRELRNIVERAVLLSPGDRIQVNDLAIGQTETERVEAPPVAEITGLGEIKIALPPWGLALEDVERKLIEAALKEAKGNITRAAQLLHLSRDTLRYRMKKHRLEG
jgi:two-component system response regulator AtoC